MQYVASEMQAVEEKENDTSRREKRRLRTLQTLHFI